jgi:peptidoglycan/xylan/chitin deacetylase (PgdA/CDA1 family)
MVARSVDVPRLSVDKRATSSLSNPTGETIQGIACCTSPCWRTEAEVRRAVVAGTVVVTGVAAAFGAVLVKNAASPDSPAAPLTTTSTPLSGASTSRDSTQIAGAAAPTTAAAASAPASHLAAPPCDNPDALGVSRVVEIDTTGGPGFGSENLKGLDFLRDHEVVLTFDNGPWPTTPAVLKALADQCVQATFFSIGKRAAYYPKILRQVAAAGHSIGTNTWSYADLGKKSEQEARDEIEKGFSAVHWALQGAPHAPFFRFPDLSHPQKLITYLGTRNIAIMSTDIDSFDVKIRQPEQVVASVMSKLAKRGKGIILMHDVQKPTSIVLPTILAQLKTNGYKIVFMVSKEPATTIPQYDEMVAKEVRGGLRTVNTRPVSSVIRTIQGQ